MSIERVERSSRTLDAMAAREEFLGQMRVDDSRAAGDEKPHAFVLPFVLFARALARRAMTFPSSGRHNALPV